MHGSAAAASTGQADFSICLFLRVIRKAAGAFGKCLFAKITGAAFFDDVTLHYN
jgi:hypothetical protein